MRCEQLLKRSNGTLVRLIAIGNYDVIAGSFQISIFAGVKNPGDEFETYVHPSTDVDKTLGGLSVDEYIKSGRKGLMAVVRPNEIIGITAKLREALSG